ncbi:MAG: response regulator [Cytophagia bacterium]|nr:response regulator [Cytophagia bacterium]NBW34938.1 response regulator [Cytophagia bacterium]
MTSIYLVEDDPLTASVVSTMLRNTYEAEVTVFDDGQSALIACKKKYPDILIVDYQLPGMTGIEVYTQLQPQLPEETLVIMASAIDDGTMVLKFIQQGIRNYVIKDENLHQSIIDVITEEGPKSIRKR